MNEYNSFKQRIEILKSTIKVQDNHIKDKAYIIKLKDEKIIRLETALGGHSKGLDIDLIDWVRIFKVPICQN